MLTPIFELKQDAETVTVIIKVPFIKVTDTEIFFDGYDFKFFSKPYFLRLNLPGEVLQDDSCSAKYDCDSGFFNIQMKKKFCGEYFHGLDMLTNLLKPRNVYSSSKPNIEVLDANEDEFDIDNFDWQIEQEMPEENSSLLSSGYKYGFANQRNEVVSRLQSGLSDLFDVQDPDSKELSVMKVERHDCENEKFSPDHYLADLYDDDNIKELLKFEPFWKNYKSCNDIELEEHEREQMLKFPKRNYILNKFESQSALLGLVDIICAYAYNVRSTEGDDTVESVWTIRKLAATLSWMDSYKKPKEVFVSFIRRSLCYPLYRNWELSKAILMDVISIFNLGQKILLKCLLTVHELLNNSDPHYVLNDLYITDYCIWIQTLSPTTIESLTESLKKISITKEDVDFNLEMIEKENKCEDSLKSLEEAISSVRISEELDSDDDSSEVSESSDDVDSSSDSYTTDTSSDSSDEESETESENSTDSDDDASSKLIHS